MTQAIPLQAGKYAGAGIWYDQIKEGRFTTEFEVVEQAIGAKAQITNRVFFNDDGSELYKEYSEVHFHILERNFIEVVIRSIENGEPRERRGRGYIFGNFLHYDMTVAEDIDLEGTYLVEDGAVEIFGSSSNRGNYTVWQEQLQRVESE
jgi:hypothetical protein